MSVFIASTEGLLTLPRALLCTTRAASQPIRQNISGKEGPPLPPPEGGSLDTKTHIFFPPRSVQAAAGQLIAPRALSKPASLAFRPECNPPARTTPASRTHHPLHQRARADGGRRGADPADLGTTSERTLEAPPPANPLRARVTRCANPRIGTRPTRHAPRADAGDYYSSVP